MPGAPDLFHTAALRGSALATWQRDPSRLRQDANLEEDHARGYYRDRVVTELAQNAADAAAAPGGAPGRLLLRLTTGAGGARLLAANTGTPLTVDGVAALASMRASAKRTGGMVGRFGVGFAAVRSVSDELTVATRPGPTEAGAVGVAFSLAGTRGLLARAAADSPALGAEVAARHGDLPALRLPFVSPDADVPAGFTTAVELVLRGPAETAAVRQALTELSDAVLLALPALAEVRVEIDGEAPRRLADVDSRWLVTRAEGTLDPALLADRPVEERDRTGWSVTWALPRTRPAPHPGGTGGGAMEPATHTGVVHAPTPTDEPCTLPALLVASLPLDPSRRHVAPGLLTDALVARAGKTYAQLADALTNGPSADPARSTSPAGADPLALVPTGLPAGPLDAALHAAALAALRATPMLTEVGTGDRLTARTAQAITGPVGQDDAVLAALSPMIGGLVRVPADRLSQARVLGVALRDLAEVLEDLPLVAEPARWRELYTALAPHAATSREALGALPVPLADGRTVRGARGILVPGADLATLWEEHTLGAHFPGLRLVHPAAAHPVLTRAGAVEADARTVLAEDLVRAAALGGEPGGPEDADDGEARVPAVVAAVLDLAALAVRERPGAELPAWLARLSLPGPDGDLPAAELVLPGSWAATVLDALDQLDPAVADRWDAATLRAVGVRADLVTVTVPDVVAEPAADEPVEGWGDYLDHLARTFGPGAYLGDLTAVADLDAVAADAWDRLLERVAEDRHARAALLTEVRVISGGRAAHLTASSYTAWWLREELGAPFAHPRAGAARTPFLPEAPGGLAGLDDAVLTALGAVQDLAELDDAGWEAYVGGWPPVGEVPLTDALALWRALVGAGAAGLELSPQAVPVLDAGTARMVPAEEAVVGPPMWAQVRPVLPVPAGEVVRVAELLDLDAVGEALPEAVGAGAVDTPSEVLAVLPGAPAQWWECTHLRVAGVEVAWWAADGAAWATTTAGLSRALAYAAGNWAARHLVEAVLTEPGRLAELLAEHAGQ
ncbi:ATP-binding protein [Georgenia yuyongxinii]|uniref:ATP-binding protein n=1 Tax=Georgenia yuyongxinii TaxID=2589797 RepID=A0A5B8BZ69_9MICO|nr:ATP-binding protein [Georgenia yuyongxinii]QDC23709.1 ATP-binding protein [Georgenia yuyongxinii]